MYITHNLNPYSSGTCNITSMELLERNGNTYLKTEKTFSSTYYQPLFFIKDTKICNEIKLSDEKSTIIYNKIEIIHLSKAADIYKFVDEGIWCGEMKSSDEKRTTICDETKITQLSKATDINKFIQDTIQNTKSRDCGEIKLPVTFKIDAKCILPESNTGINKNSFKIKNKWEEIDIDQDKLEKEIDELGGAGIDILNPKLITRYTTIDKSTNQRYLNDSELTVRVKCGVLALLGTPLVQPILLAINIVVRFFKIIFFVELWRKANRECNFSAKCRLWNSDFVRIIFSPLVFVGIHLASIYGIFSPYNGRKLYASVERAVYGQGLLAPCFQPEATRHLLGGNIDTQNAW